jgi:hypothetical protein
MEPEEFVALVKKYCAASAADGVYSISRDPKRRQPTAFDLTLSEWIKSLDEATTEFLKYLLSETAESAIFGILCVLDGVRVVSEEQTTEPPGEFVLEFRTEHSTVLLNDQCKMLHDLL